MFPSFAKGACYSIGPSHVVKVDWPHSSCTQVYRAPTQEEEQIAVAKVVLGVILLIVGAGLLVFLLCVIVLVRLQRGKMKKRKESDFGQANPVFAQHGMSTGSEEGPAEFNEADQFAIAMLDDIDIAAARQSPPLPSSDPSQISSTCSSLPLVFGCSDVAC